MAVPEYRCSECGEQRLREHLIVKRVSFQTMGAKYKTIKSRVVGWLCFSCTYKQPEFKAKKLFAAPGFKGKKNHGE